VRLYSSRQIAAALRRLGCQQRWEATKARKGKGSHCVFVREVKQHDGTIRRRSAPIVLGLKEMDRQTLRGALKLLEISEDEFEAAVR